MKKLIVLLMVLCCGCVAPFGLGGKAERVFLPTQELITMTIAFEKAPTTEVVNLTVVLTNKSDSILRLMEPSCYWPGVMYPEIRDHHGNNYLLSSVCPTCQDWHVTETDVLINPGAEHETEFALFPSCCRDLQAGEAYSLRFHYNPVAYTKAGHRMSDGSPLVSNVLEFTLDE